MQSIQSNSPVAPTPHVQPIQLTAPIQPLESELAYHPIEPIQRAPAISLVDRATLITYLLLGVVETLMITRVVLKLLAANTIAGFVRFVYNISAPLVGPFQGIFPTPAAANSVWELSSLVAIAVYALAAWGIVRLIGIMRQRPSPSMAS